MGGLNRQAKNDFKSQYLKSSNCNDLEKRQDKRQVGVTWSYQKEIYLDAQKLCQLLFFNSSQLQKFISKDQILSLLAG